jgi:hypothetical protein
MPELTSELPDGSGNALFGGVFELHHGLIGAALRSACVPDWNASSAGDGGIAKRNRIRLYSRPGNDSPIAKSASGRSRTNVATRRGLPSIARSRHRDQFFQFRVGGKAAGTWSTTGQVSAGASSSPKRLREVVSGAIALAA